MIEKRKSKDEDMSFEEYNSTVARYRKEFPFDPQHYSDNLDLDEFLSGQPWGKNDGLSEDGGDNMDLFNVSEKKLLELEKLY